MKRTCSPAQLRALKKGRLARKRKLRAKKKNNPKKKRKVTKKKPMKRRRSTVNDLTGGSGDVNPQLFSGEGRTTAINTPHTSAFATPVSRLPKHGNRVAVMEILKIWVYPAPFTVTAVGEGYYNIWVNFGTKDFGATAATAKEASLFAYLRRNYKHAWTAGQGYMYGEDVPIEIDLTDGVGHGVLVASDYMYVQVDSHAYGSLLAIPFKILYRIKNVALTEYIGIVQSQQ